MLRLWEFDSLLQKEVRCLQLLKRDFTMSPVVVAIQRCLRICLRFGCRTDTGVRRGRYFTRPWNSLSIPFCRILKDSNDCRGANTMCRYRLQGSCNGYLSTFPERHSRDGLLSA